MKLVIHLMPGNISCWPGEDPSRVIASHAKTLLISSLFLWEPSLLPSCPSMLPPYRARNFFYLALFAPQGSIGLVPKHALTV
jgi:hypothetical protein